MDAVIHNFGEPDQGSPFECYGATGWTVDDILQVHPDMPEKDVREWLEENAKYITEAMCEAGWDAINALL